MKFDPVPVPGAFPIEGKGGLTVAIEQWVHSDALRALLDAFGHRVAGLSVGSQLADLDAFTARHWDFRKGAERDSSRSPTLAPNVHNLVIEAATALGMVGSTRPRFRDYDHVLVLGGLLRACVLRPRYAAELCSEAIDTSSVVCLGGFRPLSDDELRLASVAGIPSVANELDAMDAGARQAFGLGPPVRVSRGGPAGTNQAWEVREYCDEVLAADVSVVAAPSTDPQRRANTADTYVYWATSRTAIGPADRLLLVTSSIYVPYQHLEAVRSLALQFGAQVETVGVEVAESADPALRQTFSASNYLQEIRSTIRSLRSLYDSIARTAPEG